MQQDQRLSYTFFYIIMHPFVEFDYKDIIFLLLMQCFNRFCRIYKQKTIK
jgi:hypothetical protein